MRDDEFEWDDEKARINLDKHEISFELAKRVFEDPSRNEDLDDDLDDSNFQWFRRDSTKSGK